MLGRRCVVHSGARCDVSFDLVEEPSHRVRADLNWGREAIDLDVAPDLGATLSGHLVNRRPADQLAMAGLICGAGRRRARSRYFLMAWCPQWGGAYFNLRSGFALSATFPLCPVFVRVHLFLSAKSQHNDALRRNKATRQLAKSRYKSQASTHRHQGASVPMIGTHCWVRILGRYAPDDGESRSAIL